MKLKIIKLEKTNKITNKYLIYIHNLSLVIIRLKTSKSLLIFEQSENKISRNNINEKAVTIVVKNKTAIYLNLII